MTWQTELADAIVKNVTMDELKRILGRLGRIPDVEIPDGANLLMAADAVVFKSKGNWTVPLVSELLRLRPVGFAPFRAAHEEFASLPLKTSERTAVETGLRAAFRTVDDLKDLVQETDSSVKLDFIFNGHWQPAPEEMIGPLVEWFDDRAQIGLLIGAALRLNKSPVLAATVQPVTRAINARAVKSGLVILNPIETCLISQRVFINRLALRSAISAWTHNAAKTIVAIDGGERVGKSYSVELLRYVAATKREFELAEIDLREEQKTGFTPKALARRILLQLGRNGDLPSMPTEADAGTRWFIEMCDWLQGIARNSGSVWVISLDGFFQGDLPQSTRDMVMELVKRAALAGSPLRLVLIQYSESLASSISRVHRETVAPPSRQDLVDYFKTLRAQHSIEIDDEGIEIIVEDINAKTQLQNIETVAIAAQSWVDELLSSIA